MNSTIDRQLISQFVMIVAACVGGWLLVVDPKISELRGLEAVMAETPGDVALLDQRRVERLAKRIQQVRSRVAQINAHNHFGEDPSQMYGLVLALAEKHGVVVRRLVADSASGSAGQEAIEQVTTFHMMAEGDYEPLANFLSRVDKLEGFIRPVSLTVKPGGNSGRAYVIGEYAWETVSFEMPEVLSKMMGGTRVDG